MPEQPLTPEDIKRVKGLGFLHNKGTDCFSGRVITVNGVISSAQANCIAEAAERFGNGRITFTTRLTVEVQGIPFDQIEPFRTFLSRQGLETGGTGAKVRPIVACKGTTCQYGLIDTFELAKSVHDRFYTGYRNVLLPHKFKIAVGGCPNNCVKPDLNDLGIIGQRIPQMNEASCRGCATCAIEKTCPVHAPKVANKVLKIDASVCNQCGRCVGKCPFKAIPSGQTGYKVTIGGRWGKQVRQGTPLGVIFFSEAETLDVVEKAILLFREQGFPGERFASMIERLGLKTVEKQLLSDDLLTRKASILAAPTP